MYCFSYSQENPKVIPEETGMSEHFSDHQLLCFSPRISSTSLVPILSQFLQDAPEILKRVGLINTQPQNIMDILKWNKWTFCVHHTKHIGPKPNTPIDKICTLKTHFWASQTHRIPLVIIRIWSIWTVSNSRVIKLLFPSYTCGKPTGSRPTCSPVQLAVVCDLKRLRLRSLQGVFFMGRLLWTHYPVLLIHPCVQPTSHLLAGSVSNLLTEEGEYVRVLDQRSYTPSAASLWCWISPECTLNVALQTHQIFIIRLRYSLN